MRSTRALPASNPLGFGRGRAWLVDDAGEKDWNVSDDLRLFATTFAASFLFVSILIA